MITVRYIVFCLASASACAEARPLLEPRATADVVTLQRSDDEPFVLPVSRFLPAGRARGCEAPPYRGFDFWVGSWNAFSTSPSSFVGTNRISKGLSGCIVEERWLDAQGHSGRSINAYDASTSQWHQFWMEASGGSFTFNGQAAPGSMVLAGTRPTSPIDSTPVTDRTTWTDLSRGRVRQFGELSSDGSTWTPTYDITYHKAARPEPIVEVDLGFCSSPARPRYHAFDFLLGDWTVRRGSASGIVSSRVGTSVSGCLVEERMKGPGGYEAVAYSGFWSLTFVWNRVQVDNRGVRIYLSGPATLTGVNMTMTGQRVDRDGVATDIRVEWAVASPTTVTQTWFFSTDGGVTWSPPYTLTMSR